MIGKIFGRLTIIGEEKGKRSRFVCQCSCGTTKAIASNHILSGNTISCGCFNNEQRKTMNVKHGHVSIENGKQILSREYISWRQMKQRCYNPVYAPYKHYGGRGITVCEEWRNDFSQFLKDMGPRPENTSIDRIDNDKGYSPKNCQWASRSDQNKNRRAFNRAGLIR